MKIIRLTSFPATAIGRTRVLVKVETDEGIAGWGECYMIGPERAVMEMLIYLEPWFIGEDPRRVEFLAHRANQQFRFPPGGTGLAALSGIEHALWDIAGLAAGVPTYQLLGGHVRDRVRIYEGLDSTSTIEAVVVAAHERHAQNGTKAFKFSSAWLRPYLYGRNALAGRAAASMFSHFRSHTPTEWELAIDLHAQIFEPVRAAQLANAVAEYDPMFVEEGLRPENRGAWEQFRRQTGVTLATGECLYGRFEFLDILQRRVADIVQPDVCLCGGLLEMKKIADLAAAHYVTVAPHNPMGPIATAVNLHFAASTPNFHSLEYIDPRGSGADDWVIDPYLPTDGHLQLRPDRPGLGISVDEAAIRRSPQVTWVRRAPVRPDGSTWYI